MVRDEEARLVDGLNLYYCMNVGSHSDKTYVGKRAIQSVPSGHWAIRDLPNECNLPISQFQYYLYLNHLQDRQAHRYYDCPLHIIT